MGTAVVKGLVRTESTRFMRHLLVIKTVVGLLLW